MFWYEDLTLNEEYTPLISRRWYVNDEWLAAYVHPQPVRLGCSSPKAPSAAEGCTAEEAGAQVTLGHTGRAREVSADA